MLNLFKRKKTLEEQIQILAKCGICLNAGTTIDDLLAVFDRTEYEKNPFTMLMAVMGGEKEMKEGEWMSDNVWHFDTECIEDHGDYTRIAQRLSVLAGSELPLQDIKDHVDIEAGVAWLSFKLDGHDYKWNAKVEDDWVDTEIINKFRELIVSRKTDKKFIYFSEGGQDCIICCLTTVQLHELNDLTGIKFDQLQ